MFWFVCGIIVALIGLAWIALAEPSQVTKEVQFVDERGFARTRNETQEVPTKWFGFVILVVALLLIFLSCWARVGTRNVGVPTVFGKPTGETFSAGLNFKAPWVKVTDIDATIQPEEYFGKRAISVKIADGGDAKVGLAYRWRINPDGADKVYADYRKSDVEINEAVRKALVTTNVKAAINEEFGSYDPLAGAKLDGLSPEELAKQKINVVPDYKALNAAIQANVEEKIKGIGDLIDIQSVTISSVQLPETTQNRINAYTAAVQNTKIALQEVATKDAQASGNRRLAASLKDPNVLVSKCFDALAAGDFTLPAGGSCWPGGTGGVVIPSAK